MILALILAATISSPSIGEIVTLPEWMPTSISADNTPGGSTNALSRRIDGTTLASVAAAEEAFFERMYYLNACDAAPSASGSLRFVGLGLVDPATVTYEVYRVHGALFPATNGSYGASSPGDRIFPKTRRFFWPKYDQIRDSVVGSGLWYPASSDSSLQFWGDDGAYLVPARGYSVSHTTSIVDFAPPAYPTFGWITPADVVSTLSSWRGGRTLHACRNDGFFRFYSTSFRYLYPPGLHVFATGLGSSELAQFESAHEIAPAATFASFLNSVYNSTNDYSILTNASKRLLFERMAAFNQVAATMDRTYCDISPCTTLGGTATNTHYVVRTESTGLLPASAIAIVDGVPEISETASVAWSNAVTTVSATNTPATMGNGHIWAGISDINMDTYCDAFSAEGLKVAAEAKVPASAFDDLFDNIPAQVSAVAISVYSHNDDLRSPWAYLTFDAYGYSWSATAYAPAKEISGAFQIVSGASAEYDYTRTAPGQALRPRSTYYPAGVAFDSGRIKEVELALCWQSYEGAVEYPEDFDPLPNDYKVSRLRCATDTYSTSSDMLAFVAGEYAAMNAYAPARLTEHLGFDPSDWMSVQGITSDAEYRVRGSISLSATLTFSPATNLVATVYPPDATHSTNRVYFSDNAGIAGRWAIGVSAAEHSTPPTNINQYAIAVIPEPLQRIDWGFKALRLDMLNEE